MINNVNISKDSKESFAVYQEMITIVDKSIYALKEEDAFKFLGCAPIFRGRIHNAQRVHPSERILNIIRKYLPSVKIITPHLLLCACRCIAQHNGGLTVISFPGE